MKIAIVTVYDSFINYGSYLQAFALKSSLEELGHEVYFIRRMNDDDILKRFDALSWENGKIKKGRKLYVLRQIRRIIKYMKDYSANRKRFKVSQSDWKQLKIITSNEAKKIGMDCYVCGSDEIWNIHNKDIDMPFYTCSWLEDEKRIAYAISSGNTCFDELDELSRKAISAFDIVMSRDANTLEITSKLCNNVTSVVCDPTILYGRTQFSRYANVENRYGKYMLVYSYVYSKKQKELLRKYADEHGLKIVSACIRADFVDEVIYSSALEFPALIRNAECMYTSTFHGTIFGLMFAKKLCCVARLEKIKFLLQECDAMEYAVNEDADYDVVAKAFAKSVNHNIVEQKMKVMGANAHKILTDALERVRH